ncbi:MAG: hypothetical protein V1827_01625 [Candidatus Micrarchaeota archaeon]
MPVQVTDPKKRERSPLNGYREITGLIVDRGRREPSEGTKRASDSLKDTSVRLKSKADEARAFLTAADARRKDGRLDDRTFSAETARVRVALALCRSIEQMIKPAEDLAMDEKEPNNVALKVVSVAANYLLTEMSGASFLRIQPYSRSDPARREGEIQIRTDIAHDLHTAIKGILINEDKAYDIPAQLDVEILEINNILPGQR